MGIRKHEPVRSCVACRRRGPKLDFIRVVRRADGQAAIDETGKAGGRGAYICPDQTCLKTATKKRAFTRALRLTTEAALSLDGLHEELMQKIQDRREAIR